MDVMTAVLTRRSEHHLTEPAPGDAEFAYLLKAAAASPDHGMLRPWRWILIRGEHRRTLGASFAHDADDDRREQAAAQALRAPLLATLIHVPRTPHRIPQWEQLAATTAMAHSLMLLLHARGFGSIWRTGGSAQSKEAHRLLGVAEEERLLGWLHIGTPDRKNAPKRRAPADVTSRLSTFTPELTPSGRCLSARPQPAGVDQAE